jgi:hypothetical protein
MRIVLAGSFALVVAALIVLFWRQEPISAATSTSPQHESTGEPSRVQLTRNQAGSAPASGAAPAQSYSGFERAQRIERQLHQAKLDGEARAQRIAASFARQPRDPAWAEGAEARVLLAMGDASMDEFSRQGAIEDVDCRRAVCRVRAHFPGGGEALDWAGPLMMGLSDSFPAAFMQRVSLPDGRVEMNLYVASKGGIGLLEGS